MFHRAWLELLILSYSLIMLHDFAIVVVVVVVYFMAIVSVSLFVVAVCKLLQPL